MSRLKLSEYFSKDIIRLIQKKLLSDRSKYTFLEEITEIYIYYTCFICKKSKTILPLKLLLKISNFSTKDDMIDNSVLHYHCEKCYPIFLMKMLKNQIYLKTK